jgi:hypothetical protein
MIETPFAEVSFTGFTRFFRIILKHPVNPVKLTSAKRRVDHS